MSIDTTFHPITQTIVCDNSAPQAFPGAALSQGATTVRAVARVANCYLAWGPPGGTPSAPAAPAAVGPLAIPAGASGVIGLTVGVPCYLEVPLNSKFISSAVFATSNVELTGGIGGSGG